MTASTNENKNGGGGGFLRNRLKLAFSSSNDILSGISNNISSRLSMFSTASSSSANLESSPQHGTDYDSDDGDPPLPLHMLPDTPEPMINFQLERKSPVSMKERLKETFKLENLKPALEDFMHSDESSEPSTLPTNTPESPKAGFRFKLSTINQSLPKKLGDYKALAIRTLSGETTEDASGDKGATSCAINVECVDPSADTVDYKNEGAVKKSESRELDNASTCLSSRSFTSLHSLHATGPDPYDKFRYKPDMPCSSGSASEGGVGRSTSFDSSDSDPHKKLWIRSGSQTSLQSWASSLSYDSQAEEVNEVKEFMRSFVEDVFKSPHSIAVDRKAEFGRLAQIEQGRLWFARCINAKRCCKCVSEATFFSLIQHFAVMLFECSEADDFSPAKSLMNMCFTYFHEVNSPGGKPDRKDFVYQYLRQQTIWKSLRFWNAAFFDALQCERSLRPVVTREQVENSRFDTMKDELHYQENITFGQLGTFTCNMHAFGLTKEMVTEFLRKQVTIASLRDDQVKLLRENVDRMYSNRQEWN